MCYPQTPGKVYDEQLGYKLRAECGWNRTTPKSKSVSAASHTHEAVAYGRLASHPITGRGVGLALPNPR